MGKKPRGFAAMDAEMQRAIARKGGRAAHRSGRAHEFSSTEAAEAGRKGGRRVSRDRQHMAEIGRKGGRVAHRRGTAHEWDPAEAAEAGRRGGRARVRVPGEKRGYGQRGRSGGRVLAGLGEGRTSPGKGGRARDVRQGSAAQETRARRQGANAR
jgi:uncharacterized protein